MPCHHHPTPELCHTFESLTSYCYSITGVRGGADGWGTALQAWWSWVRIPMVWHNTSGHTMALGSTQTLTKVSTKNISLGKGGRCVQLTTLPPSRDDCLETWELHPPGAPWACNRPEQVLRYLFYLYMVTTDLRSESMPGLIEMCSAVEPCRRRPGLPIVCKEMHFFEKEN